MERKPLQACLRIYSCLTALSSFDTGGGIAQGPIGKNNIRDITVQDIARYYDSTVEHSHEVLDPGKHIILVNYLQVPIRMKVTEISEIIEEFPELLGHPTLHKSVSLFQALVRKGDQGSIFCISMTIRGTYYQACHQPFSLSDLESLPGPSQSERGFPRTPVVSGNDGKRLSARKDFVDHILEVCGSTFEQFWKIDVDEIIDEFYSSRGIEWMIGINRR